MVADELGHRRDKFSVALEQALPAEDIQAKPRSAEGHDQPPHILQMAHGLRSNQRKQNAAITEKLLVQAVRSK